MNEERVVVSVCCLAYNQEKYIAQCLEGIVSQKTSFRFELLIHDDASRDATRDIIESYRLKYPDIVKPIFQTENKFSKGEKISVKYLYPRAKGTYIAFCEGDDYWCDPDKLQLQVDFLERNPDYGMCFTKVRQFDQETQTFLPEEFGGELTGFRQLLNIGNCVPTLTVCARRDLIERYVAEVQPQEKNWLMGDYPIWLFITHHSKARFFDRATGVYRIHRNSVSHFTESDKRLKFVHSTYDILFYFSRKFGVPLDIHIWMRDKIAFETYRNPEISIIYKFAFFCARNPVAFTVFSGIYEFLRRVLRKARKCIGYSIDHQ